MMPSTRTINTKTLSFESALDSGRRPPRDIPDPMFKKYFRTTMEDRTKWLAESIRSFLNKKQWFLGQQIFQKQIGFMSRIAQLKCTITSGVD
jgi:hypothetical protein